MLMKSELEKKIVSKIVNSDPVLDKDGLWDSISPSLPKKKKSRKGLWMFFGLLMISIFAVLTIPKKAPQLANTVHNIEPLSVKNEELNTNANIPNLSNDIEKDLLVRSTVNTKVESVSASKHALIGEFGISSSDNDEDVSYEIFEKSTFDDFSHLPKSKHREEYTGTSITQHYQGLNYTRPLPSIALTAGITEIIPVRSQLSSVTISGGYFLANRKFDLTDNVLMNEFNQRNTTEKALDGYRFSIMYSKRLYKNVHFSLGLAYQSVSESNEYLDTSYQIVQKTVLIERIHTENGIEDITKQIPVTQTTISQNLRYNSFQSWAIPIQVSMDWKKRRMGFELGVGADFVFSKSTSGNIFYNDNYYNLSQDNDRILNNDSALFFNFSGGLSYDVTDRLCTLLKARAIISMSDIYNESYGIKHKQNLYGVDMGFRYKF